MSSQQKKIIPKLKKKLQGFLTDESGKIAKEDVLKMSMVAMGIASLVTELPDTHAVISRSVSPGLPYPAVTDPANHNNGPVGPTRLVRITSVSCAPVNRIVNGHVNYTPTVNLGSPLYNLYSHGNHASHGSHSQW